MSKLRIPYAADGTRFDPVTCRRANGYTVGEKGNERTFAEFDDPFASLISACLSRAGAARTPTAIGVSW
jgi:hypothetical protein